MTNLGQNVINRVCKEVNFWMHAGGDANLDNKKYIMNEEFYGFEANQAMVDDLESLV